MLVFVIDNNNKPLMPCKSRKAKKFLDQNKASVKFLTPFTILLKNNLEKSHRVDARVIANQCLLEPKTFYVAKEARKNNKAEKVVKGFQLFDKVKYEKKEVFIFGRRVSGYFKIAHLDGTTVHNSVNYKKLKLLEKRKTLLINKKRSDTSSPWLKPEVSVSSF